MIKEKNIKKLSKFNIKRPGTIYIPYDTPSISLILDPIAEPKITKYRDVVRIGDTML